MHVQFTVDEFTGGRSEFETSSKKPTRAQHMVDMLDLLELRTCPKGASGDCILYGTTSASCIHFVCCIATLATFVRIYEQLPFHSWILTMPLALFVIAFMFCFSSFRQSAMVISSGMTGILVGFLSGVIGNDLVRPAAANRHFLLVVLCSAELLHVLVIISVIVRLFPAASRMTPGIFVAFCVLLCVGPVCFIKVFWVEEYSGVPSLSLAVTVFLCATVCAAILVIFHRRTLPNRLSLLVWSIAFGIAIGFQVSYLDSQQWDRNRQHFPIPGTMLGVPLAFMMPAARGTTATTETNKPFWLGRFCAVSHFSVGLHIVCYVGARFMFASILDTRYWLMVSSSEHSPSQDLWYCCAGLVVYIVLFLMPIFYDLSASGRVFFLVIYLVLYVCIGVAHGAVANGYFIDDLLGLTLLAIDMESHIDSRMDSGQVV